MKRVALYVRVSTYEQMHGQSIANQRQLLEDYAAAHGYHIVDVYDDTGHSAHKDYRTRPELCRLLDDCRAGEIDLILFTRLDRWSRLVKGYHEIQDILDANNVKWRAITQDYETETSNGRLVINLVLSTAQMEAEMDADRTKMGKEYARMKQRWTGGPAPTGYKIVDHHLEKDAEAAEWLSFFFATYLTTWSYKRTIEAVLERYNVNIPINTAKHYLSNPAYYGLAGGYLKCEPYITEEQHNAIVAHGKQYHREGGKADYIFGGLCRCAKCGCKMQGSSHVATGQRYLYYRCQGLNAQKHPQVSISELNLEKWLVGHFSALVEGHNEMSATASSKTTVDHQKKKKTLEQKLSRVKTLYEIGDIEFDEYKQKRDQLKRQIAEIPDDSKIKPIAIEKNWLDGYRMLDQKHKRQVWASVIREIVIGDGDPEIIFF